MTIVLAIETSQRLGSVAVRNARGEIDVEVLREAKRHDDDLIPAIDRMMDRQGLGPRDLGAVGVSVGPGGFTGLRIAVATVKMFAEALEVNVVPVPSALVAAQATEVGGERVLVVLASKGDTFWATYLQRDQAGGRWVIDERQKPGLITSEAFSLGGVDRVLADGHFPAAARQRVEAEGVGIVEPRFTADACLEVTEQLLAEGGVVDPLELLPIYPRKPEAVSLWERKLKAGM